MVLAKLVESDPAVSDVFPFRVELELTGQLAGVGLKRLAGAFLAEHGNAKVAELLRTR